MKYIQEYKKITRPYFREEPIDFILFRPIAYVLVKLIFSRLPFTPNHISLFALLLGVMAGILFSIGTQASLWYGALLLLFYSVVDCCDGMTMRLKGNGTPYGEMVDMLVDFLSCTALFLGLGFGLSHYLIDPVVPVYISIVLAGVSLFFHVSIYNHYSVLYRDNAQFDPETREAKLVKMSNTLSQLKNEKRDYFIQFLNWGYLTFCRLQPARSSQVYQGDDYCKRNKLTIFLWGWISGSSHLGMLALSLLWMRPEIYFVYAIGFANLWLILVSLLQLKMNRPIKPVKNYDASYLSS